MDFLKNVLAGRKKLLLMNDLKAVNVPRFEELNIKSILKQAQQEDAINLYLPNVTKTSLINREYLFNVRKILKMLKTFF